MDKKFTHREITQLGKDLQMAKINVYKKWGFSIDEISRVMGIPVSVIRRIEKKQKAESK